LREWVGPKHQEFHEEKKRESTQKKKEGATGKDTKEVKLGCKGSNRVQWPKLVAMTWLKGSPNCYEPGERGGCAVEEGHNLSRRPARTREEEVKKKISDPPKDPKGPGESTPEEE